MEILKRIFRIKNKIIPKVVICFSSHGRMGEKINFRWIGVVTNEYTSKEGVDHYDIKVLMGQDKNDNAYTYCLEKAYQIQQLGFNLYIHYI